jgi:hypothetical protein
MRKRKHRGLQWCWCVCLPVALEVAGAVDDDGMQRSPAASVSAPADDATKKAILELIDTLVARRSVTDLELLEKVLKADREKSVYASNAREQYALRRRVDSPIAVDFSAGVSWQTGPNLERSQQSLRVVLDMARACITLDDVVARYGPVQHPPGISTHPPSRKYHPYSGVYYRLNGIVEVSFSFQFYVCAGSFDVNVLRSSEGTK